MCVGIAENAQESACAVLMFASDASPNPTEFFAWAVQFTRVCWLNPQMVSFPSESSAATTVVASVWYSLLQWNYNLNNNSKYSCQIHVPVTFMQL